MLKCMWSLLDRSKMQLLACPADTQARARIWKYAAWVVRARAGLALLTAATVALYSSSCIAQIEMPNAPTRQGGVVVAQSGKGHGCQEPAIPNGNASLLKGIARWFMQGGLINEQQFTKNCISRLLDVSEVQMGQDSDSRWMSGKNFGVNFGAPGAQFSITIAVKDGRRQGHLNLLFKKHLGPHFEDLAAALGPWRHVNQIPLHGPAPAATGAHGNETVCLEPCSPKSSSYAVFNEDGSLHQMFLTQQEESTR